MASSSSNDNDKNSTPEEIAALRQSLFSEGIVDPQYVELENLQDEKSPNFVEEVYKVFFKSMYETIPEMHTALEKSPFNFVEMDRVLHKLKGSSSNIGAKKILEKVNQMRAHCAIQNVDGMKEVLRELGKEFLDTQVKLEDYFEAARGSTKTAPEPK